MVNLKSVVTSQGKSTIPIGFLYTQLPNQQAPNQIWPYLEWTDITSQYAGLFFRAEGGGSAAFGYEQNENSPMIEKVYHVGYNLSKAQSDMIWNNDQNDYEKFMYEGHIDMDTETTKILHVAYAPKTIVLPQNDVRGVEGIRFKNRLGEVRPKNKAIRIWKRTK